MRNSLAPLIAAVIVFAVGLLLIRPTVDRGQGGPEVNAGILRLPKRNPLRTASVELSGSSVGVLESGSPDDGRWRTIVIAGGDREPTTRAAMLALGEVLFAADMVAIMDPVLGAAEPTPPLPLPAERVIRIATRDAAIDGTAGGPWHATVAFTISEPRLPAGHPGAGLQIPGADHAAVVVVTHTGQAQAATAIDWPGRWAATGRSIVQAMLRTVLPHDGLHRPDNLASSDWGTPVPFPPTTSELRWAGCFQQDLVRGWIGRIDGLSVSTKTGALEPAAAPLIRLLKRGAWEPVEGNGPWTLWSRLRDGQHQWFGMRAESDGWSLSMWVERPDVSGLVSNWITSLATGDAEARQHLQRILAVPNLATADRVRIEQALR